MNLYSNSDCCPVCLQSSQQGKYSTEWLSVNCPNCGEFIITQEAKLEAQHKISNDETNKARASHGIRKRAASGQQVKVYSYDINSLLETELPSIMEQADNLLSHFASGTKEPGKSQRIAASEEWIGVTGAISKASVDALLGYLTNENYLLIPNTGQMRTYCMTVRGWVHYEELQKQAKDSTQAFMAMKFGEPELDAIVDGIFRPAVAQTGFRLQKLNDEQSAGLIDDQLRVHIRRSRFLIADLTHGNKGAYWEAGFAEGIGIPVIYTCKESEFGKESHFDTNHHLTVLWNPDKPEEAAEKLKATIRATLPESAKMEDD
jgi:hypothetical protein